MTLYQNILNFIESRHRAGQEWVSGLEIDDEMRAKFKKRTNAERRCRELSTSCDKNITPASKWFRRLTRDESQGYVRYKINPAHTSGDKVISKTASNLVKYMCYNCLGTGIIIGGRDCVFCGGKGYSINPVKLEQPDQECLRDMNYSPLTQEFIDWFHGRGESYAKLTVKFYKDGEPYFSSQGAECTLRDYLRVKNEPAKQGRLLDFQSPTRFAR